VTGILQRRWCSGEPPQPSSSPTATGRHGGDEGQDQPHGRALEAALTGEGRLQRHSASKPVRGLVLW
jgi:hypothetical protein